MNYALHVLRLKLWEWESVKERLDMKEVKNGGSHKKNDSGKYEMTLISIKELTEAIEVIVRAAAVQEMTAIPKNK